MHKIAAVAQQHNIHFHVDAAWGGALQFSQIYRARLLGIDQADSITFCPHKQLYLSQGISLCLLRDTRTASKIATNANYQAQNGSYDLGQYTVEGSRPAQALLLHASLHLLGQQGYAWLVEQGMSKAAYFTALLQNTSYFELIGDPDLNIVNYRYIPAALRPIRNYSEFENNQISEVVTAIQQRQFSLGSNFVSKTLVQNNTSHDGPITVFRVVLSNPLTTTDDMREVLSDQLRLAADLEGSSESLSPAVLSHLPDGSAIENDKWHVPIGKPIANTELFVLDAHLNLLPIGVPGHLYVGGDGLARGYLNRPDLNIQKFVSNPFSSRGERAKLFQTGDYVRWLPDGNLEFLSRTDHQVKIRGFRIELGEIENVILLNEFIKDVVVLVKQSNVGEQYLAAYIVSTVINFTGTDTSAQKGTSEQDLIIRNLRLHLQNFLPEYMVPAVFIFMDSMPLTPSGKIDRKRLPASDISALTKTFVQPRTDTERAICQIWQEILGIGNASITDNFFHIGGHSLSSTRVLTKIDIAFGIKIPIKIFFLNPNIESLAAYIDTLAINNSNLNHFEGADSLDEGFF